MAEQLAGNGGFNGHHAGFLKNQRDRQDAANGDRLSEIA